MGVKFEVKNQTKWETIVKIQTAMKSCIKYGFQFDTKSMTRQKI